MGVGLRSCLIRKPEHPGVSVAQESKAAMVELHIDDTTSIPEDLHASLLQAARRAENGRHRLATASDVDMKAWIQSEHQVHGAAAPARLVLNA